MDNDTVFHIRWHIWLMNQMYQLDRVSTPCASAATSSSESESLKINKTNFNKNTILLAAAAGIATSCV